MELRQLATFRAVAHTLSFTNAAQVLGYAQSSITAQIQALEDELDVRLFDRLGKRIALTSAGQRLLIYADRILNLSDEARSAVSASQEVAGTITLSAPETLCTYRLPKLLRESSVRYPDLRLIFRSLPFRDIRRAVLDGAIDLAFSFEDSPDTSNLNTETLRVEPLALIAPPRHALAQRSVVQPADIEGEALLLNEPGCCYRNLFERSLSAAGVYPSISLEFDSIEAIKQCVMAGMGLSMLPAVAVEHEIAAGDLVALRWSEPGFHVFTRMMWHKDKWLSPAIVAFVNLARELLGSEAVPASA